MTSPNTQAIVDAIAINIANFEKLKALAPDVARAADIVIDALRAGRAIYFCGNGGSAADAQHLAAELSGRFLKNRRALPGVAARRATATTPYTGCTLHPTLTVRCTLH